MKKSPMYWQPIAGESMADVVVRVRHFLETLSACSAGLRVVVVCHYRTIHAFRILLEEIPQEEYSALLRESMPNCAIWWYSRRDLDGARVHWQVSSVRRIAVQPDGTAEIDAHPVQGDVLERRAAPADRDDPAGRQQRRQRPRRRRRRRPPRQPPVKASDVDGIAPLRAPAAPGASTLGTEEGATGRGARR